MQAALVKGQEITCRGHSSICARSCSLLSPSSLLQRIGEHSRGLESTDTDFILLVHTGTVRVSFLDSSGKQKASINVLPLWCRTRTEQDKKIHKYS